MNAPHDNHTESRLVRLETRVELHARELEELKSTSESLNKALLSIEKNLTQIKYVSLGGLCGLAAQELGLITVLKALL